MVSNEQTKTRDTAAWIGREGVAALSPVFGGTLLRPGDTGYDEAARVWNGMIERRPALIARCVNAEDVAATVGFAARHRLLLSVKGGGHNIAGTASCDGGVMIDLSLMDKVELNLEQWRARAGGGATWSDLDKATQAHGLAAPGGLVSKTGIAGLTLGGGLGWLRRKHGLSCDNLVAVEIVTADGQIRRASEEENPDLFWGLRGGGGNFGIVTRFEFDLHPVGPDVMFAFVLYPLEQGRKTLKGWREFCETAPDEASSIVLCGSVPEEEPFPPEIHGRQFIALATVHAGPVEAGEQALQPLRELGRPLCDFSGPAPYQEIQCSFDGDYPDGRRYYWKSLYLKHFNEAAIDTVLELAAERPSALTTVDIWQLGGAMGRIAPEATAFGSREAPYLLGVESNWDDPQADEVNRTWTREACARMERFSTGTSYLNFEPDSVAIADPDSRRQERLARLKRQYDPENLFRLNHNILPE